MLAQTTNPPAHENEASSSSVEAIGPYWSISHPEYDAKSLPELAQAMQWLRPGDVVYVALVRRHTLTEEDLSAAARAVIGGAA